MGFPDTLLVRGEPIFSYLMRAPRIWRGAVSAWYMGTSRDKAPTPRPATQRPTVIWRQSVSEEIWMIMPTPKRMHQSEMDNLRPILSAIGAATNAPTKVPMESWDLS